MKPLEATTPIARWLLRITLLLFLYFNYFALVRGLNFDSLPFYFASIYLLSAGFIILGPLFSKPALTIVPSILIFILSAYLGIKNISGIHDAGIMKYLIPASIAFLFLSTGNKS